MPLRSCRVTITEPDGVEHSTEVTADSLFEAVGLALRATDVSARGGRPEEQHRFDEGGLRLRCGHAHIVRSDAPSNSACTTAGPLRLISGGPNRVQYPKLI
jgi:hypothetical protein